MCKHRYIHARQVCTCIQIHTDLPGKAEVVVPAPGKAEVVVPAPSKAEVVVPAPGKTEVVVPDTGFVSAELVSVAVTVVFLVLVDPAIGVTFVFSGFVETAIFFVVVV